MFKLADDREGREELYCGRDRVFLGTAAFHALTGTLNTGLAGVIVTPPASEETR